MSKTEPRTRAAQYQHAYRQRLKAGEVNRRPVDPVKVVQKLLALYPYDIFAIRVALATKLQNYKPWEKLGITKEAWWARRRHDRETLRPRTRPKRSKAAAATAHARAAKAAKATKIAKATKATWSLPFTGFPRFNRRIDLSVPALERWQREGVDTLVFTGTKVIGFKTHAAAKLSAREEDEIRGLKSFLSSLIRHQAKFL
jgi:hypothetical protein